MNFALGTVQFGLDYGVANVGGRVCVDEAKAIVARAHQVGINTLDTAIVYGESESVLGSLGVQSWNVVTKLPSLPHECKNVMQYVKKQIDESFERLKLTRVYGLLLHSPSQLHEDIGPELYTALQSLKAEGMVSKIGVSVYGPAELEDLSGNYRFDIVQAPLNILDRSLVETGWAQRLQNNGVEVHARSIFLQGLLLMPKSRRPSKFERWGDIWTEWDRWLAETGLTPLQACVLYLDGLDCIDRFVVGVDSLAQLNEIIDAVGDRLPSLPQFKKLRDNRLTNPATWNHL